MADVIEYRFRLRRGLATTWTALNDVLLAGELGLEIDTGRVKIGDGTTGWNALPYSFETGGAASVQAVASTSTLTPAATNDVVIVSAQAAALTIANPSGTEEEGRGFVLRIRDNGVARALTWGTKYRAVGGALPAATVAGGWLYLPATYNGTDDKWDVFLDQTEGQASVQAVTSASTITPSAKNDMIVVSALAGSLTIANPTEVPVWGDGFVVALKDNGTSRALTWGGDYRGMGTGLTAATTAGKWMYFPVTYNQSDSKWDVFPPTVQQ